MSAYDPAAATATRSAGREVLMTGNSAFEIHGAPRPGWALLVVKGELDISTALTFRRRVRALRAANTHVCVDLSEVEFIDGAGAHALEDVLAEGRQGSWRVEVAPNMSHQARRFFELVQDAGLRMDF